MKLLELFAGSRSIGVVAEQMGHTVCSVDVEKFNNIDIAIDIIKLTADMLPFMPDMVWASPPCTTYSIAAISSHRRGCSPFSLLAIESDELIKHTLELIKNIGCIFYIENPVGMLRKMPFMKNIDRATITYCSYGDIRMKPTDIWSNNIYSLYNTEGWIPRHKCFNNNAHCHHERAPRGSKTGTQGLPNDYERSRIPTELCVDIIKYTEKSCKNIWKIDKSLLSLC